MREITRPQKGMRFLSQWLDALPENAVIDKVKTGCGATTLAIDQPKDTIIAAPYTALIVNKVNQPKHKDVLLGLYGPTDDEFKSVIADYLTTHLRIKIITTYDSLPKVCKTLTALGHNPYEDTHLVIDEWHLMFMSYGYRGGAARGVLQEAKRFRSVTYLSATPVERKYWFDEMLCLDEWIIPWPDAKQIETCRIKSQFPVKVAAMLCKNRITDGIGANYHMFFNSVRGIVEVIQYAGLKPDECRIICADRNENRKKLPEGFQIESTNAPVKTINFYTSTCFEGCDIYDENGRTFIICDPYRPNTLLDITTSMRQICGRIRKTNHKGVAIIWNNTRHEDTDSFDAFEARLHKDRIDAEQNVTAINSMTSDLRRQWIANLDHFDLPLVSIEDDLVYVDKYMINLLLVNYKDAHQNYVTQEDFDVELTKNGFYVVEDLRTNNDFVGLMSIETISFKDCCEQYAEIKSKQGIFVFHEDERLVRLRNLNQEACDAVDRLGIDEVRRMKYHRQNIHRQLVKESTLPQKVKIKRELDTRLKKFEAYTIPTIRKTLGEIYGDVGLGKTPKATNLSEFYRLRKTKKEGHDAYVIEGDAFIIQ